MTMHLNRNRPKKKLTTDAAGTSKSSDRSHPAVVHGNYAHIIFDGLKGIKISF